MAQLPGSPQGTIHGIHACATTALPSQALTDMAYDALSVTPFRFPGLTWVHDTIVIIERDDTCSNHQVVLDQEPHYRGALHMNVPDRRV